VHAPTVTRELSVITLRFRAPAGLSSSKVAPISCQELPTHLVYVCDSTTKANGLLENQRNQHVRPRQPHTSLLYSHGVLQSYSQFLISTCCIIFVSSRVVQTVLVVLHLRHFVGSGVRIFISKSRPSVMCLLISNYGLEGIIC
jgi:hypothetical protein